MEDSRPDFITVINSLLLLTDYQANLLNYIGSGDIKEIKNAVVASAKAASILKVPVVLTSINSGVNGEFLDDISGIFPGKEIIEREAQNIDALEDQRILSILRKKGREKIIISGLWTSRSFTETAIHAVLEGYDVFGLIDACGDISAEEHNSGVHRMLKAGVTPITWMSLTSEWMNGWSNPSRNEETEESFDKYSTMLAFLSKH